MFIKKRLFALVYCVILALVLIFGIKAGAIMFWNYLTEEPRTRMEIVVDTFTKYDNRARENNRDLTYYKVDIDREITKLTGKRYVSAKYILEKFHESEEYREDMARRAVEGKHRFGRR